MKALVGFPRMGPGPTAGGGLAPPERALVPRPVGAGTSGAAPERGVGPGPVGAPCPFKARPRQHSFYSLLLFSQFDQNVYFVFEQQGIVQSPPSHLPSAMGLTVMMSLLFPWPAAVTATTQMLY